MLDTRVPIAFLNASNVNHTVCDSKTLKKMLIPSTSCNANQDMHGKMIWTRSARESSVAPPLPCIGGFRLQPRKNIPNLKNLSPIPNSTIFGRGRKRGAQTMVSKLGSPSFGLPKAAFTASTSSVINSSNDLSSNRLKALPQRQNESSASDLPTLVCHAMQSMYIRSPIPSTPSIQDTLIRDRESSYPLIVSSPSFKSCPYRQRPRCESLCSLESSTKPSSSVVGAPRIASTYGSPLRKANSISHNNEILSTPRSYCHVANTSQTPATPTSTRTLPSPRTTPLPRSTRLTPRSRPRNGDLSCESSIFLSLNERLDHNSTGNEGSSIFSFEGGVESLEEAREKSAIRVSTSRTRTLTSRVGGIKEECLRVETRSLLGSQDSTSTLDYIISANAHVAGLECDGSLSDASEESFVLANPVILAQERDATTMPPPRPSRRRRMSPTLFPIPIDSVHTNSDNEASIETESNVACEIIHDLSLIAEIVVQSQVDDWSPNNGDNASDDLHHSELGEKAKSVKIRCDHKYSGRLLPIESYCSLVGLALTESSSSSSIVDSLTEPAAPQTKMDFLIHSMPPASPSKASVRISRSDADTAHSTIASMAVFQRPYQLQSTHI